MEDTKLRIYQNDTPARPLRRVKAYMIDSVLMILVSFIFIIISISIISSTSSYKSKENTITSEMIECYKIEEEAKIYEFIDNSNGLYQNPREQNLIFEDYCLMHILYSYSMDSTPFERYGVEINNPKDLPVASYSSDTLAYFYTDYVPKYNNYNGKSNDIVDMRSLSPKQYFYKAYKENSVEISMWVFDEENNTLPYLKGYDAVDLYRYLFDSNDYQAGLTVYNYLATNYQKLWNKQVNELVYSSRFSEHYNVYKSNYAQCARMINLTCAGCFALTFFFIWILPQLIFKDSQTFGKKILNLKVCDIEGYKARTHQVIIRNVCSFVQSFGLLLFSCIISGGLSSGFMYPLFYVGQVGFSLFAITTICLVISIISMMVMFIEKRNRAVEDILSETWVIDFRYHLDFVEQKKIEIEENEKETQKDHIKTSNEDQIYFDSSCFNNTERKEKDGE